jgi:hypothetical protein
MRRVSRSAAARVLRGYQVEGRGRQRGFDEPCVPPVDLDPGVSGLLGGAVEGHLRYATALT